MSRSLSRQATAEQSPERDIITIILPADRDGTSGAKAARCATAAWSTTRPTFWLHYFSCVLLPSRGFSLAYLCLCPLGHKVTAAAGSRERRKTSRPGEIAIWSEKEMSSASDEKCKWNVESKGKKKIKRDLQQTFKGRKEKIKKTGELKEPWQWQIVNSYASRPWNMTWQKAEAGRTLPPQPGCVCCKWEESLLAHTGLTSPSPAAIASNGTRTGLGTSSGPNCGIHCRQGSSALSMAACLVW